MRRFGEPVEHGVGHGGVFGEHVVPVLNRQLAGDDCRFSGVPVLDKFHEVQQLLAVQHLDPEVFDDQQIHLGHPVEELGGLGFDAGHLHGFQEFAHIEVTDPIARETGLIAECRGEITLADAGRTGD